MLVNVTDVFTSEGKVLTQEFAWETAEITHCLLYTSGDDSALLVFKQRFFAEILYLE